VTTRAPGPAVPPTPAVPSTPAQHDRHDRILEAATEMLTLGGPDALQMKELSQRADVSLATLYRYFPAKAHVLLAITLNRYRRALARVRSEPPAGGSVRERVTAHLLREFGAEQREPQLTAALYAAISETIRDYRDVIGQIEQAHLRVLRHVAAGGETLSPRHDAALPVVADVFTAATRRWLAGVSSPDQARFEIRLGCHLLDLPEDALEASWRAPRGPLGDPANRQ
jgi:TetR/AcrR family transcriptional regulator, cholesterol catabolism regulator